MDSTPKRSGRTAPRAGASDVNAATDGAAPAERGSKTPAGFTEWPANEPAARRLSRIGIFRRTGHGLRRIV
jgi:hypothetical protein